MYTYRLGDLCVLGGLKRKLVAVSELPEGAFGACPYIELEGNSAIRICECREIISYESEKTEIAVNGMRVTVRGRKMTIESLGGGTVRLKGKICGILLSDEKKGGNADA